MGTYSLNAASAALHQAIDDFTAAHDAASTTDPILARSAAETALALIQSAKDQWGTNAGYKLLAASERHIRFALGEDPS